MINETLLEKFFSKHLSEAELLEFKRRYDTETDFKQEVDFLNNLQLVSETEEEVKFKTQLATYESELSKKKKCALL